MKLSKLILVNWGSLRSDEYPIGNMTLLTGPTGSGKSTLLDARFAHPHWMRSGSTIAEGASRTRAMRWVAFTKSDAFAS